MYYFVEVACVIAEMWLIHLFLSQSRRTNISVCPPKVM